MPRAKAGACSRLDRVRTFGDSCSVPTHVAGAALFGSSVRQETRRIMRAESVRKSMIVLTLETEAAKGRADEKTKNLRILCGLDGTQTQR